MGGGGVWLYFTASAIRDSEGHIIGAVETLEDITERKEAETELQAAHEQLIAANEELRGQYEEIVRAEDAMRENEEKYRTVFENTGTAMVVIEENNIISLANSEFLKSSGFSKDEIEGKKKWTEFVVAEDLEQMAAQHRLRRQNHEQALTHYEFRIVTKSGDIRNIYLTIEVIPGTKKSVASLLDITERKKAEEALHEANKKLNLLSSITRHDINNQLTVLQGYLAILEKEQADSSSSGYLQKAATAAQQISTMITFTKEYENIGFSVPVWQDLHTLVNTAAQQVHLTNITMNNDPPPGTEVFADPMIAKVFYNLIDNAVRYGGKITTIRFSGQQSGENYQIICEDDGDGIPADKKERIFDRGFGKNTGLGLFLAREILAITGMTIQETGIEGKGARFEITVPEGEWRRSEDHR
jgi:PAS domain S-box-containing protein